MTWLSEVEGLLDAIQSRFPDRHHVPNGLVGCTCPHVPGRHDFTGCTALVEDAATTQTKNTETEEQAESLAALAIRYRAICVEAGFTENAAELMALDYLRSLFAFAGRWPTS